MAALNYYIGFIKSKAFGNQEGTIQIITGSIYQGKGFGKKILFWALENIPGKRAVLHVAEWNKKAVELYKKAGFEISETINIG